MRLTADDAGDPAGRLGVRFIVGVAVPLALVALAYALWWISDRLLYIGPFDRATFGWAVVIPIWIAAPVVAGFGWRRLPLRVAVLAAVVVGSAISGVAAILFWLAVVYPACDYGPVRASGEWIAPSLMLGLAIGGGLTVSGLVTSKLVRDGRPWRAVALGAGTEVAMVFAAILVGGLMVMGPGCQRPPI